MIEYRLDLSLCQEVVSQRQAEEIRKIINELGVGGRIDIFVFSLCDFEVSDELKDFRRGIFVVQYLELQNSLE